MIIRKSVFEKVLPIPPCKAEDTLITFKILEMGYKAIFAKDCWVETEITSNRKREITRNITCSKVLKRI